MLISDLPSSQAHFPYQAGLHGNNSPPHPPPFLSLPVRRVNRPATAQLRRIRVDVADQAVASGSTPTCASLASRTPSPLLLHHMSRPTTPPLPSYARRARVHAHHRHNTESSLSSRLQPSRPPFPLAERGCHLVTSPSAPAVPVLEQLD
jgi:hypothetical protein